MGTRPSIRSNDVELEDLGPQLEFPAPEESFWVLQVCEKSYFCRVRDYFESEFKLLRRQALGDRAVFQ